MNADEVIAAHLDWKSRLYRAMTLQEKLDVAEVSSDARCRFGKWLYSEARERFGKWPEYAQCVARHAAFHREAGKVAHNMARLRRSDRRGHLQPRAFLPLGGRPFSCKGVCPWSPAQRRR